MKSKKNLTIHHLNGVKVCSPFGECGFINDFPKERTPINSEKRE